MRVLLLGARGRTGRLVADELIARGHDVQPYAGDVRDATALAQAVVGVDVVVSALGPRRGDRTLHRDLAGVLQPAMTSAGVTRYLGVGGAGVTLPGDRKSPRDAAISWLMARFGGSAVADKLAEARSWAGGSLDWTIVRPPRLTDAPVTGRVEHHAARSPRHTSLSRGDLARFLVDELEQRRYPRAAPLVARG